MKVDNEFSELELETLFPSAKNWPSFYQHQKALQSAASEGTALMRDAIAQFDKFDNDRDLSAEGKKRRRAEVATEVLRKLEDSRALKLAREAVDHALTKYRERIDEKLVLQRNAPQLQQQLSVHSQIRDRLHCMANEVEQMRFLERHGADPAVSRAVLTAPAWLSGLSDTAYQFVRSLHEKSAPSEVLAEKKFVQDALPEIERGFRAAKARIAKRGGLQDGPTDPVTNKPVPNFAVVPANKGGAGEEQHYGVE